MEILKRIDLTISINSHSILDQQHDLLDIEIRHCDTLDACRSHESPPFETRQPRVLGKKSARTRLTNWSIPHRHRERECRRGSMVPRR